MPKNLKIFSLISFVAFLALSLYAVTMVKNALEIFEPDFEFDEIEEEYW